MDELEAKGILSTNVLDLINAGLEYIPCKKIQVGLEELVTMEHPLLGAC